jgi:uncharacterized protein with GYD domain
MGRYDVVVALETLDDEMETKQALSHNPKGNVSAETLCSFADDEHRKIIAALP